MADSAEEAARLEKSLRSATSLQREMVREAMRLKGEMSKLTEGTEEYERTLQFTKDAWAKVQDLASKGVDITSGKTRVLVEHIMSFGETGADAFKKVTGSAEDFYATLRMLGAEDDTLMTARFKERVDKAKAALDAISASEEDKEKMASALAMSGADTHTNQLKVMRDAYVRYHRDNIGDQKKVVEEIDRLNKRIALSARSHMDDEGAAEKDKQERINKMREGGLSRFAKQGTAAGEIARRLGFASGKAWDPMSKGGEVAAGAMQGMGMGLGQILKTLTPMAALGAAAANALIGLIGGMDKMRVVGGKAFGVIGQTGPLALSSISDAAAKAVGVTDEITNAFGGQMEMLKYSRSIGGGLWDKYIPAAHKAMSTFVSHRGEVDKFTKAMVDMGVTGGLVGLNLEESMGVGADLFKSLNLAAADGQSVFEDLIATTRAMGLSFKDAQRSMVEMGRYSARFGSQKSIIAMQAGLAVGKDVGTEPQRAAWSAELSRGVFGQDVTTLTQNLMAGGMSKENADRLMYNAVNDKGGGMPELQMRAMQERLRAIVGPELRQKFFEGKGSHLEMAEVLKASGMGEMGNILLKDEFRGKFKDIMFKDPKELGELGKKLQAAQKEADPLESAKRVQLQQVDALTAIQGIVAEIRTIIAQAVAGGIKDIFFGARGGYAAMKEGDMETKYKPT